MADVMTVQELKDRIDQKTKPFLLDIREPHEREICRLEDSQHIQMREIPTRFSELNREQEIVVYCRSGQRSAQVCAFLKQQGFDQIRNLAGGILAWAKEIDPSTPTY